MMFRQFFVHHMSSRSLLTPSRRWLRSSRAGERYSKTLPWSLPTFSLDGLVLLITTPRFLISVLSHLAHDLNFFLVCLAMKHKLTSSTPFLLANSFPHVYHIIAHVKPKTRLRDLEGYFFVPRRQGSVFVFPLFHASSVAHSTNNI